MTNFNISPYFDDYDELKNFLRMLFIPGRAVQARELTQMQTILQNQVSKLGNFIFKNGTAIVGARVKINFEKIYLEVGGPLIESEWLDKTVNKVGNINVQAYVTGVDTVNNLLYITEVSGTFAAADGVEVTGTPAINDTVVVKSKATEAYLEPGIVYVDGSFIILPDSQSLIIEATGTTGEYRIGYLYVEDVVTSNDDQTLLDPAGGSFNFNAPGADRYRGQAIMASYEISETPADNFVEIMHIGNGEVKTNQDEVQFADLLDLLAQRTFDTNGNYTVKHFPIRIEDHDTNADKLKVSLEPGKAFVLGYEQSTISTTEIETDRSRDFESINNSKIYADYGPYLLVRNVGGVPDINGIFNINTKEQVTLYSDYSAGGTALAAGIRVTAMIKDTSGYLRIYLSNISGITDLLASVKSISNGSVTANVYVENGLSIVENRSKNVPIFPLSIENVKGISDVTYDFLKAFEGISVSGGGVANFVGPDDVSDFPSTGAGIMLVINANTNTVITSYTFGGSTPSSSGVPSTMSLTGLPGGINIDVIVRMDKRVGSAKVKTITTRTDTLVASGGAVTLARTDIMEILSIKETAIPANTVDPATVILNNGRKDYYYDYGTITGLPQDISYDIQYKYFAHSGSGDYFDVSSYDTVANQAIDPNIYENIPTYTSKDGSSQFTLRDCIDFRRSVIDLPAGTNSLYPGDDISLDYDYYVGRIDKVYIDEYGNFGVVKGVPARYPDIPNDLDNAMTLYVLSLPPYTFVPEDVEIKLIDNRNYTMRDIGALERRIEGLEYYTALNLLEQKTADLSITDVNGLEKFKNGIVVDDFSGHGVGDVYSGDYNCSIDPENGILRSPFEVESVDLAVNTSSNMTLHDNIATLAYTTEPLIEQLFASSWSNVNPYNVFMFVGKMTLNPPSDNWIDTVRKPDVVVNVEGANDNMKEISNWFGTRWNDWNTIWTGQKVETKGGKWGWGNVFGGFRKKRTTITTTTTVQKRVGDTLRVVPGTIEKSLGDRVVDTTIAPFMRSKTVTWTVHGMKPNVTLRAWFDGVEVTDKCTGLTTNSIGYATGTFTIPNPNTDSRKFRVGTKIFRLADDPTSPSTSSEAEYSAFGLVETKQNTIVSIDNPKVEQAQLTETRVQSSTVTKTTRKRKRWFDPVAESFIINQEGGVFLSSIDIFFRTKSSTLPVTLYIVENENGIPTQTIVPYSEVSINPVSVNTSTNGSLATNFQFSDPVYLQDGVEYSFVVMSNSDEYELFVADMGGLDLISNKIISKQPFAGVMFKSQNGSTWTPDQNKDIKFRINRCVFNIGTNGILNLQSLSGLDDISATTLMLNVDNILLNNTDINWTYAFGSDTPAVIDNKINLDMLGVKTIADATPGPEVRLKIAGTITSIQDNISPVISITRNSAILINNVINGTDAGVYLTRTISLQNPSDDLHVILEAKLPGTSDIELYFKTTQSFIGRYVEVLPINPLDALIERTCRVYNDNGGTIDDSGDTVVVTDIDNNTSPTRIYLKDITNYDLMAVGKVIVYDDLAPNSIADFTGAESVGAYAFYSNEVWERVNNLNGATAPSSTNDDWDRVPSATLSSAINDEADAPWRPMVLKENVDPTLDTESDFVEYTFVPKAVVDEEFSSFTVKIQLRTNSPVQIPEVRKFRALAVY